MELLDQVYDQETYLGFLASKFKLSKNLAPVAIDNNAVESFEQLGKITTSDEKELPVFEIHIKPNTKLSRNRVQLRNLVAKRITNEDGALAVYIDDQNEQWRFSFIAIEYNYTDDGVKKTQTASKRFTYLLGENAQTRTAKDRFGQLNQQSTLENLKAAFAVEALNKEFYDKLYKWYEKAQKQVVFPNDEQAENHIQTSLIRLLTRLLFIWFLKEKKLINTDLFEQNKLQTLIDYDKPSSFYKAILQNLFFATLSTEIENREFRIKGVHGKSKDYGNQYRYRYHKLVKDKKKWQESFSHTPFLNGGLFESLDKKLKPKNEDDNKLINSWNANIRPEKHMIRMEGFSERPENKNRLQVPNNLFFNDDETGLIDLFNQYQFTVEESTPLDVEVALDPELLGKVFENLLASYNPETGKQARKATGSFYTPREIVSYMVDESLKQYFKQHTDLDENQINNLFVEQEIEQEVEKKTHLNQQQITAIIRAIDSLKILDPAVGSGAYPMGILQRLIFILEKIDPENTHFKQQQIDKAKQISDVASRDSAIEAINQVFSQQNQHNAYGKKLMLIENAIYGVDIQPIAIQICKLRFFISLTIEQTTNQDENNNYGIKALPNLETKFIVANSLLPLGEMPWQRGTTLGVFDTGIKELQQQLAEIRHKHFSVKTLTTKCEYREQDKALRQQMLDELTQGGITPAVEASMKKIVHWDLYNQNSIADWFNPEWQFGVKEGFDIVIGNPPYLREKNNSYRFNPINKSVFGQEYHQGKMDFWFYFLHKAIDIIKKQGIISFITPSYWINSAGASRLILRVKNNLNFVNVVDIGKLKIFDNVAGHHMVSIFRQGKIDDAIIYKKIENNLNDIFRNKDTQNIKIMLLQNKNLFTENNEINFHYSSNPFIDNFHTLGDIFDVSQGVVEASDKISKKSFKNSLRNDLFAGKGIFVLTENEVNNCGFNDVEKKLLKPYLSANDVKKYEISIKKHKVLIYSDKNTKQDIEKKKDFKNIKKHLDNLAEFITSSNKPYGLHRARNENYFLKEKIIFKGMFKSPEFVLDYSGYYFGFSFSSIIQKDKSYSLKYLLAILNSRMANHWFYTNGKHRGVGVDIGVNKLKQFPVKIASDNAQAPFEKLVDKILTAKQQTQDTSDYESQIDQMVYNLYNLTTDEIAMIEETK